MLATYIENDGSLVVEFAVPGREAEDISISSTESSGLIINVAPVEDTPGSILATPMTYEVRRVDPAFSIDGVHAVCQYGLLKLIFPPSPNTNVLASKLDMQAFMRQQRFHLN